MIQSNNPTLTDFFMDVFEFGPVCVFLWENKTGEWPVVQVTGNVEKIFGWTADEFIRGDVTDADITHPDDYERIVEEENAWKEADTDKGVLHLVTDRYSPFDSQHEMSLMSNGMQAIINLTGTVGRNIESPNDARNIQREVWTFRLDPDNRDRFHEKVRDFLLDMEQEAARVMTPLESEQQHDGQITAGVGFYYFEESDDD